MSVTISTTGGQIPGTSRRERRCAKNALFVKARATAWVIKKIGRAAEKMEMRREPFKRTDCKRIWSGAHGWKSHALATPGEFTLSGREAATLLVCFGIPAICKVGGVGKGRRPSTAVIPRPKLSKRVSPQGECRSQRRAKAKVCLGYYRNDPSIVRYSSGFRFEEAHLQEVEEKRVVAEVERGRFLKSEKELEKNEEMRSRDAATREVEARDRRLIREEELRKRGRDAGGKLVPLNFKEKMVAEVRKKMKEAKERKEAQCQQVSPSREAQKTEYKGFQRFV